LIMARSMRVPNRPMAPVKLLVNCSFNWSHLSSACPATRAM
jgi:hypothetical protein